MCVFMCERARERERDRAREGQYTLKGFVPELAYIHVGAAKHV